MTAYENIVVVGCGRLGSILASELSRLGSNVMVIDRDEAAFDNLAPEFSGFRVTGDAAELAVLQQARLEQADCVLATTQQDNVNLMVAQVAKTMFGVGKVLARVHDPSREEVFRAFGVEMVCPTTLAAAAFLSALEG
jgi:trk system potassium uptake protein TrkA